MTHSLEAKAREEADAIIAKHWIAHCYPGVEAEKGNTAIAIASTILTHLKRIQELEEGLKPFAGIVEFADRMETTVTVPRRFCRHATALLKEGK